MKSRFLLFLAAVLLGATPVALAQGQLKQSTIGRPKDIAIVKSKPLLVLLKDEDPDELKVLANRPQELATYQAYIAGYNSHLRELATKIWKLSPSVEFRQESEYTALRKTRKAEFVVFKHLRFTQVIMHTYGKQPDYDSYAKARYSGVSVMVLEIVGDGDERLVGRVQLSQGPVYTSDLSFSLAYIQHYLQERAAGRSDGDIEDDIAKNAKQLPAKTLLIDQAIAVKMAPEDIKEVYPYPYQLVPRQVIETAAATNDGRYAYVRLIPDTPTITRQVAVDAATGDVLSAWKPNMLTLINDGSYVDKTSLKNLAKLVAK